VAWRDVSSFRRTRLLAEHLSRRTSARLYLGNEISLEVSSGWPAHVTTSSSADEKLSDSAVHYG
jgi:hypothetical protein